MRILHVITSLRTGGAEKLMVDLLPRLKESGHEVDLLLFDGVDTPFWHQAEAAGIRIFDLGVGGSVYSPVKLFKLIPFMRRYDVVHTHNTAPQLFAAMGSLFCKTRLITTEHNTSNRRRAWKWFRAIDHWMYSRYDKIICISQKAEENLRNHLGVKEDNTLSSRILTINNGVDVEKFASAKKSPELEQIAPGSRKLIMVAGFRPQKDQPTVIKALKYFPDKFHLFLVGDGERRGEFEELANTEGVSERVHFMGIRNDVAELLRATDYVVMSSHFEGLSLSSLEGMAVGKPFLASDVDGLREVVDGAGVLFPCEDAKGLAQSIINIEESEDDYKYIAELCYLRAMDFNIYKMLNGYAVIYGLNFKV